jgi:hypothetical protein
MVKNSIFTTENIHDMYLKWMNEEENGSVRKDRFISLLKDIPHDKQYEIEQWLVSAFAIGLECGYNSATTGTVDDIL